MTTRPLAVVIAPFYRCTVQEEVWTRDLMRDLLERGFVPVFLPWALRDLIQDGDPTQRPLGLECSASFIVAASRAGARFFILAGRESPGMTADIQALISAGGKAPHVAAVDERAEVTYTPPVVLEKAPPRRCPGVTGCINHGACNAADRCILVF